MMLWLVLAALLPWADPSNAQAPFVQSTWRDTIYYRATFNADSDESALLHVAAVDSYEVYFNGRMAGSDSVSARLAAYEVAIESGDNDIGIAVVNRGLGDGNGLMAFVVVGDSMVTHTTTNRRIQTWLWTADSQQGTAWTTVDAEDADWRLVQEGTMDTSQVSGTAAISSLVPVIAGLSGSVDVGATEGSLVLGRTRGVNLAFGKPSNHPEVVDGNLSKGWRTPPSALSFSADVNLQDRRLIDKVRVITLGRNAREFEQKSLRGYSVQVSDDQVRWTEVGVRHDIGCRPGLNLPCVGLDVDPSQYLWTQVAFRPTWTRFVRFVIVAVSPGNTPEIGEFEVFGDGFAAEGIYLSPPLSLGPGGSTKNFGRVRWEATVPERTQLSVQFRAGDTIADFEAVETGWSEPDSSGAWFLGIEPSQLLQYRVLMETNDQNFSPEFEHLEIDFSTDVPVSLALGRVLPNKVAIGVDTTFVYNLDLEFEQGDLGVERLSIEVPSAAVLDEDAAINDLLSAWESTQRTLTLTFAPPLMESVQLEIPLHARTYASAHEFRASVFGPGTGTGGAVSENPLNVTENQGTDPITDEVYSWSLAASETPGDLLSGVTANPPVITPNGDGINDRAVVEFILSVVDIPTGVSIQIFDLGGRLVRDLNPVPVAAGVYSGPGAPGTWDGTDGHGNRVAPGLYLFRVEADLDTGNETKSGVIAVVY